MLIKKNLIPSEQNLKQLSTQLDKLCKFLDELYDINCGGCCYVAACLAECLQKDNISYQVIILECPDDIIKFSELKKSCLHYFLSINNVDINGYDDVGDDEYKIFNNISYRSLFNHYKKCIWNDFYDSEKNKFIKKIIKQYYEDFTSSLRER
jgi:hypothetical protein